MAALILTGDRRLDRFFAKLPSLVQNKGVKKALQDGAAPVLEEAKHRVPVDTGRLKKSLAVRRPKASKVKASIRIVARRGSFKGFHAHLLEFGTKFMSPRPYLLPARVAKREESTRAMAESLRAFIEGAASLNG